MKIATEILIKARGLIEAKGWTQGSWAKNANGIDCMWFSNDAQCYCAEGSLYAAAGWEHAGSRNVEDAYAFLKAVVGDIVPNWNDAKGRNKAQVLAKFDAAIELSQVAG